MTLAADIPATEAAPLGWARRAEAWLDRKGRGAWIAAMVLGFVFFWPVGLALVFYITYTNRWNRNMFSMTSCKRSNRRMAKHAYGAMKPSGNATILSRTPSASGEAVAWVSISRTFPA